MAVATKAPKRKIVFTGVAIDVRYNQCNVHGCEEGALTAIWMDGRSQFNVCAWHLKEKLESGDWVFQLKR